MCGIIGFTGNKSASEILLNGLASLEYRGYDSAGISVSSENGIVTLKQAGRVSALHKKANNTIGLDGKCGIGHTRWATHGAPSEANAHPHASCSLVLVHNGIIENYLALRHELEEKNYVFISETDTECAAHLTDMYYKETKDPISAIHMTVKRLVGSFAFGIIFKDRPNEIYATRKDSPLIVAKNEEGTFIASDIPALLPHTRDIVRLDEGEIAKLTPTSIEYFDKNGSKTEKTAETVKWSVDAAEKEGYAHFMLKEIYEQPKALHRAMAQRIGENGVPDFSKDGIDDSMLSDIDSISIVGCGSAWHAGLVGKALFEALAGIPTTVDIASEYRYAPSVTVGKALVIVISQSGETSDTLGALRLSKANGKKVLGIVNVVGSAIARESDAVLYTNAGPEIAVATTKGYATQVTALMLLAIKAGICKGKLSEAAADSLCDELVNKIPEHVTEIIKRRDEIALLAKKVYDHEHLFYIGRGLDSVAAQECSLKLKEVSYVHSEAYSASELKHGTLSLVTDGTPVIALATDKKYFDKMTGNIREVKSRGGRIILVCNDEFAYPDEYANEIFTLPACNPILAPMLTVVFSQLLAYEVSILRGCDVDHPRNLAKSVTVE